MNQRFEKWFTEKPEMGAILCFAVVIALAFPFELLVFHRYPSSAGFVGSGGATLGPYINLKAKQRAMRQDSKHL